MSPDFELFDHTADVGLRVSGGSLPVLFANAAHGLMTFMVMDLDSLRPEGVEAVALSSESTDDLLVDWLNDRLYRFDALEEIHAWAELETVEEGRLAGRSRFVRIDWDRHRFHTEVKSITYHGLRLERKGDLWLAEVIFDL